MERVLQALHRVRALARRAERGEDPEAQELDGALIALRQTPDHSAYEALLAGFARHGALRGPHGRRRLFYVARGIERWLVGALPRRFAR